MNGKIDVAVASVLFVVIAAWGTLCAFHLIWPL
jgi:hypothetical protein